MKTTFFKISAIALLLGYLLTSCLGSTTSKIHPENSISYIGLNDETFTTYAFTQEGLMITNPYIKSLEPGDFYYLNYAWTSKDPVSKYGIYSVAEAKAGKSGAHPIQNMGARSFLQMNLANYPKGFENEDIYPYILEVRPSYYSPYQIFNDLWIFFYRTLAYEDDTVIRDRSGQYRNNIMPVITLQPSNQGSKPEQVVLNAYLERIDRTPIDKSKPRKEYGGWAVVDMRPVREYFERQLEFSGTQQQMKATRIQFQFYKYNTTSKQYEDKVTKVGSLSSVEEGIDGSSNYGMFIYKNQE